MKKTIGNLLIMMLALVMLLGLSACSKDEKEAKDTEVSSSAVDAQKEMDPVESSAQESSEKEEDTVSSEEAAPEKEEDTTEKTPALAPEVKTEAETAPVAPEVVTSVADETPAQKEPESAPVASKDVAMSYKGKSASSLEGAIGQPNSKSYASSCIGDGEDGEWYYDGFTVYTYRDTDGSERVEDVF